MCVFSLVLITTASCSKNELSILHSDTNSSSVAKFDATNEKDYLKKLTVILILNGGTISKKCIEVYYGKEYELPTPSYINNDTYYEFLGWKLKNEIVPLCGVWTYSSTDVYLHASWSNEKISLNYTLGSYPQSEVKSAVLKGKLNKLAGNLPDSELGKQGYEDWNVYCYLFNEEDIDYYAAGMWYQDVTYENVKYRGVYFTGYRPYATSLTSSASNSYQDNNNYKINTVYWFKYEPIVWRVLKSDDNEKFIVTKKIIDSQQYNSRMGSFDWNTYYDSDIRYWINDDFYNTAFTDDEKNTIKTTEVNIESDRLAIHSTEDKVFLLNCDDIYNDYLNFSSNKEIRGYATDYAKCQGVYVETSNSCSDYWLRDPLQMSASFARTISSDPYDGTGGDGLNFALSECTCVGVRPAIKVNTIV